MVLQDLVQRSGVIAFNLGDLHPSTLRLLWIMKEWLFEWVTIVLNPCSNIWMFQQQLVQVLYLQYQGRLRQAGRCLTKDKGVFNGTF